MTPANSATTALVAAYYVHFNAANWPEMLDLLTEDVIHDINQGEREIGIPAFRTFLARMDRCYKERLTHIHVMASSDGRHAAAEYVVEGTYKATDDGLPPATGQTYRIAGGAFFDIRDGRIARVSNAYNLNEWLRQISSSAA